MSFPKDVEKIGRAMRPHTSEVYLIGQIIREIKEWHKKETTFFIETLIIKCTLKILGFT